MFVTHPFGGVLEVMASWITNDSIIASASSKHSVWPAEAYYPTAVGVGNVFLLPTTDIAGDTKANQNRIRELATVHMFKGMRLACSVAEAVVTPITPGDIAYSC
jgi:hypothetical protein